MRILIVTLFFLGFSLVADAQYFTLSGKIVDAQLQPISYVTVRLKNEDLGTTSDAKGKYELKVPNGKHELVFSMIGYTQQTAVVIIDKQNVTQNIILQKSTNTITGIRVTNTKKDRSEEIVRNTIEAKEKLQKNAGSFNVKMYIKASQQKEPPKTATRFFGKVFYDSTEIKKDSSTKAKDALNNMSLREVVVNVDFQYPNKIKETREGVKKLGDASSLFYQSRTEGDFNFYKNLVSIPSLSEMSFLSPISYSGLIAYKYKMLNVIVKNSIKYYHIKVSPTKTGNALLEGDMIIQDSTWALTDFTFVFPKYHTPEYSFFQLQQSYSEISENNWLPTKQIFTYKSATDNKTSGVTSVYYSNYILDTIFPKKHFGEELSSTSQEAYERDSNFWNTQRAEPLSEKEVQYIQFKDSVYQITHSTKYLDSVDKETNKITAKKILFNGVTFYKRSNERNLYINSLSTIWNPLFMGGARYGTGGRYYRKLKKKKAIGGYAYANYGPNNDDIIGAMNVGYTYNPFNQGKISFNVGSSFDFIFNGDAIVNMISRSNIYKKNNFSINHKIELINGLFLDNEVEFARRFSLYNYKTVNRLLDTVYGRSKPNRPIDFPTYDVVYNVITLSYTPHQLYLREPYQKIILGSKWPTFYGKWRKGLNGIFNSQANFDYLEFGMNKKVNAGTFGIGFLSGYYGSFVNRRNINVVDYKWVRRGDPFIFYNPEYNFQSLDSTFNMFKGFAEAHYYHQFNGALINKIPYASKLKLVESAGSSFLYSKERNLIYGEAYVGLEKQIKLFGELFRFGGYFVTSYANNYSNPVQWKIGIRHYDVYRNKWE